MVSFAEINYLWSHIYSLAIKCSWLNVKAGARFSEVKIFSDMPNFDAYNSKMKQNIILSMEHEM